MCRLNHACSLTNVVKIVVNMHDHPVAAAAATRHACDRLTRAVAVRRV